MEPMTTFSVIYEPASDGTIAAYSPDVPGVVSSGRTHAEAEAGWREAIELYREALRGRGEELPAPTVRVGTVTV
jgi:predicted RNase H-like HicB family nuclease